MMRYLNDFDFNNISVVWDDLINIIESSVSAYDKADFVQPLKPYIRYGNKQNRIIAMPAYIGGEQSAVGIKWISSFPENIEKGLRRAHSVVILNNVGTGEPMGIINTSQLSVIRTVSVSATFLKYCEKANLLEGDLNVAVIGLGPIGELHFDYLYHHLGSQVKTFFIYDINCEKMENITLKYNSDPRILICKEWQDAYQNSNVVITCTVTSSPYIQEKPLLGSLHLNISLRDYGASYYDNENNVVVVDSWNEVCREGTSIELLYNEGKLFREDTISLADIILRDTLIQLKKEQSVFFNPMGMAIFDVAIASYILQIAEYQNIGTLL